MIHLLAVLHTWYRLVLELVRHTPTYSPPVASRSFAYTGELPRLRRWPAVTGDFRSLAGQLNGLQPPPQRETGQTYSEAVILNSAMSVAVRHFFSNTGPTGQRAMNAMDAKLAEKASQGLAPDVVERSKSHGEAVARHIIDWSAGDGGAVVENMGFPYEYELKPGKANWVPTSAVRQQQMPLLPGWGNNRPFAMPQGNACPLPPPPDYSEDTGIAVPQRGDGGLRNRQEHHRRAESDCPVLVRRPHALADAARPLDIDCVAIA